jgi:hypothetical protein
MAEVTYYVALPFVAADDGIAAGEPTECFNPTAAAMRAEALSRKEGHVGAVAFKRQSPIVQAQLSPGAHLCRTINRLTFAPLNVSEPWWNWRLKVGDFRSFSDECWPNLMLASL